MLGGEMWNVQLDKINYQNIMSYANTERGKGEMRESKREENAKEQSKLFRFKTGFI
jgi:hypothetical protein